MDEARIVCGLEADRLREAASLLCDAFAEKIEHELRPSSPEQAVRVYVASFDPARAVAAVGDDGAILGVAGVGAHRSPFSHLTYAILRPEFGVVGALVRRAYGLLEEFATPRDPSIARIEVLGVREDVRGRGIGSLLLEASAEFARSTGARTLTLEVVDTNGRAKELYERAGFVVTRSIRTGLLTGGAGYNGIHFMRRSLDEEPASIS
ncbi:MAG: GNAT family N-acetyltransferase [Coriobacteriia bacterium]|nr:GNAT family N-acetyltransferase [Coriobacteriia bacterium]